MNAADSFSIELPVVTEFELIGAITDLVAINAPVSTVYTTELPMTRTYNLTVER